MDSDLKANGICHDLRNGRKGPTVSDIKDGANTTLLLSENVHKDVNDIVTGQLATWLGPVQEKSLDDQNPLATNNLVDMRCNPEQRFGMVWVYAPDDPVNPDTALLDKFNRDTRPPNLSGFDYGKVNNGRIGSRFARPSSEHPEIFIAVFCGTNIRDISENIDFRVYQQLMTPNGQKAAVVSDPTNYLEEFMNPPLSDADY
jgi:hypothetical protein